MNDNLPEPVDMGGRLIPVVGTVGPGGRVALFDTPEAERLKRPPSSLQVVGYERRILTLGGVTLPVHLPRVRVRAPVTTAGDD